MEKANNDDEFISNILFTDEATFPLHGQHNSSVTRYWSRENQHRTLSLRTQYPRKLNVWAGIIGDHIIGPFFIDGNLTGIKYLNLLQHHVIPTLQQTAGINLDRVWYQHDECPAHNLAHDYLQVFVNRIIGNRGNICWTARSPDLSPNDFFLWGHVKQKVLFS